MAPNNALQRICSENIYRIRSEKGITQAQMANFLGIKQPSYWALEKAKSAITIEMLERIEPF